MKLTHSDLEKFVGDVLSKREPCPAMVLAWGWLLKQGEGGMLHNDSFKLRYFVLARVPHATVLIYYAQKCMDEEHILGYIDLRKVTAVRTEIKPITLDTGKSAASALASKFMGLMGGGGAAAAQPRPVIELVTATRVYTLAPVSGVIPAPMTTAMALGPAPGGGKPLYLFGWPFPVPASDERPDEDEATVLAGVTAGRIERDHVAAWNEVCETAQASEKATKAFPVTVLVDSSGSLPVRVILRITPCEVAIVSVEERDQCFTAIPFNDLAVWEVKMDTELHVTARTRARLVARPDRTGFTSQRPTRPTCHFVFKSQAAKPIVGVIDNHLRALAQQLNYGGPGGELDAATAAEADAAIAAEGSGAPAAPPESDDDAGGGGAKGRASTKLAGRKPAAAAARSGGSARGGAGGSDDDEPAASPPSKAASAKKLGSAASSKSLGSSKGGKAAAKAVASDDDSDEAEARRKAKAKAKAKAAAVSDDSDDAEARRKAKAKAKAKAAAAASDDDSDDAEARRKAKAKAKAKAAAAASDDDSDDAESRRKAKAKAAKKAAAAAAAASDDDD